MSLVLIGLDAAERSFIEAHRRALPRLDRVFADGRVHTLQSTSALMTGSVWPSFSTGAMPGRHGIYHHLQWDPSRMQLRRVTPGWLDYTPFWHRLEAGGCSVAAVDVPMSFPSKLARGIEIINWGAHDQLGPLDAHPPSIARKIRRRFGPHPMGWEIPLTRSGAQRADIQRRLAAGARLKGRLCRWVYQQRRWDFFLAVFGELHRGGHILWPDGSADARDTALLEVYQAVDEGLGTILDAVSPGTTVIVFAVHGMGPNVSQEHFVPRVMDAINAGRAGSRASAGRGAQHSVVRTLRERVPPAIQNAIAMSVPVWVRDAVINRQIAAGHDWNHTAGLALLADLNGYIRLSVCGREARGLLNRSGADYAHYVDRVRATFMSLRAGAPDGDPIVREVIPVAAILEGPRLDHLPDLVVTWSGTAPASRAHSDTIGEITAELATGRRGNHRPEGFCVLLAPRGAELPVDRTPTHIVDLAPLAMAALRGAGTSAS